MHRKASLLALFALIFTLFIGSTVVEAAEDKESYGTGKVYQRKMIILLNIFL